MSGSTRGEWDGILVLALSPTLPSRQSHIRGSGIGLAMVSHIVRAHGGRVTLKSERGEGSTFTIQLPMEE